MIKLNKYNTIQMYVLGVNFGKVVSSTLKDLIHLTIVKFEATVSSQLGLA